MLSTKSFSLRHHVGEKTEGIVRWKYRNTEHVSHGDEDKEVLHAGACLQSMSGHAVRGHTVSEISKKPYDPASFFLLFFLFFLFFFHNQTFFEILGSLNRFNSQQLAASQVSLRVPEAVGNEAIFLL